MLSWVVSMQKSQWGEWTHMSDKKNFSLLECCVSIELTVCGVARIYYKFRILGKIPKYSYSGRLFWVRNWGMKTILLLIQKSTERIRAFVAKEFCIFAILRLPFLQPTLLLSLQIGGSTNDLIGGTKEYKNGANI